jgi:hypothetical protein
MKNRARLLLASCDMCCIRPRPESFRQTQPYGVSAVYLADLRGQRRVELHTCIRPRLTSHSSSTSSTACLARTAALASVQLLIAFWGVATVLHGRGDGYAAAIRLTSRASYGVLAHFYFRCTITAELACLQLLAEYDPLVAVSNKCYGRSMYALSYVDTAASTCTSGTRSRPSAYEQGHSGRLFRVFALRGARASNLFGFTGCRFFASGVTDMMHSPRDS